jgi:glucoamylase
VDNGRALSAANYTDEAPIWFVTVPFSARASFEYKYYVRQLNGSILYESDPNRVYTVPANCAGTATINDSFR